MEVAVTMITQQAAPITRPRKLIDFCRGFTSVSATEWPWSRFAMRPTCVFIPVAVTSPLPWPETTLVALYIMLVWKAVSVSVGVSVLVFSCASPVITDSFVCRSTVSVTLMSAGTTSPMRMRTMSPTTRSREATDLSMPSRITIAVSEDIPASAAPASCPAYSPTAFIVDTKRTIAMSTYVLVSSPIRYVMEAATVVSRKIMFLPWARKMLRKDSLAGGSRMFGPSRSRRAFASFDERPSFCISAKVL
mmetsp:Transcript_24778/g.73717  ORF Transcript_24778/g.73717 Transcript_24778/m.73717 type:complete len:248 (-) Transcript_24778:123-866(-)